MIKGARPDVRAANGMNVSRSTGNLIQRNRLHHNQDTGLDFATSANDNLSRQNLLYLNGDHGTDHVDCSGNVHIGDVAYRNYKDGFSFEGSAIRHKVYNCIGIENGIAVRPADGTLEFLGRLDHQVKLRGFRIELEEIDAVLKQHSSVRDSIVILREDVPGDPRIVAYVVAQSSPVPTASELSRFVAGKLPSFMIPSFFVVLDSLPLMPNGKVDRRALPVPARGRDRAIFVPPHEMRANDPCAGDAQLRARRRRNARRAGRARGAN